MGRRTRGELAWYLASPFDDELATEAALAIKTDLHAEQTLNGLYPILMDQKSVLLMPRHLRNAGISLDAIGFSTSLVRSTPPLSYRSLFPVPEIAQWTFADFGDVLTTHQNLLWAAVFDLKAALGNAGFLLLSGRAMEALYPQYEGRLGFDVDLWFPELNTALEALEVGVADLGFGLRYASIDNPKVEPHLSAGLTRTVDGYEINVGVITGAFHAGRYRRAERPFRGSFAEPLGDRSRDIAVNGVMMKTPSPEDLLVILAARVRRKNRVQLINLSDAAVILRNTTDLDVPLVLALSGRYGLDVELGIVLTCVENRWPGSVDGALQILVDKAPRLHVAATMRSILSSGPAPVRRMEMWAFEVTDIRTAQNSSWARAASTWVAQEVHKQSMRGRRAVRRFARGQPPRTRDSRGDPLCGVAAPDILGEFPRCVGRRPANVWRDAVSDEMKDVADRLVLLMGAEGHECRRLWAT